MILPAYVNGCWVYFAESVSNMQFLLLVTLYIFSKYMYVLNINILV